MLRVAVLSLSSVECQFEPRLFRQMQCLNPCIRNRPAIVGTLPLQFVTSYCAYCLDQAESELEMTMRYLFAAVLLCMLNPALRAADENPQGDLWYGTMDVGTRLFRFRVEPVPEANDSGVVNIVSNR